MAHNESPANLAIEFRILIFTPFNYSKKSLFTCQLLLFSYSLEKFSKNNKIIQLSIKKIALFNSDELNILIFFLWDILKIKPFLTFFIQS